MKKKLTQEEKINYAWECVKYAENYEIDIVVMNIRILDKDIKSKERKKLSSLIRTREEQVESMYDKARSFVSGVPPQGRAYTRTGKFLYFKSSKHEVFIPVLAFLEKEKKLPKMLYPADIEVGCDNNKLQKSSEELALLKVNE